MNINCQSSVVGRQPDHEPVGTDPSAVLAEPSSAENLLKAES